MKVLVEEHGSECWVGGMRSSTVSDFIGGRFIEKVGLCGSKARQGRGKRGIGTQYLEYFKGASVAHGSLTCGGKTCFRVFT